MAKVKNGEAMKKKVLKKTFHSFLQLSLAIQKKCNFLGE